MSDPKDSKSPDELFEQAIKDMEFVDVAFCESSKDAIEGNEAMCTYMSNLLVMYLSDYIVRRKKNQPLDMQLLAAVKVAQAATSMATLFKAGSEALLDGNMNMLDMANKELNQVADLIELKLEGFAKQMVPGAEVRKAPPKTPPPTTTFSSDKDEPLNDYDAFNRALQQALDRNGKPPGGTSGEN